MIGWVVYISAILLLTFLWTKKRASIEKLIALTILVALFTSPHLHFHDLTLLLLPIYTFVRSRRVDKFIAIMFPIAWSLILLVSNISPVLQYSSPYLLMLALGSAHFINQKNN
jgi:hypothetical protein